MEDEPEPTPLGAKKEAGRGEAAGTFGKPAVCLLVSCEQLLKRQITLAMQTHFQLLQLSVDTASVGCYFSPCAGFFMQLADRAKLQAGLLMDLILTQGGSVELPAISEPCPNLAHDTAEGEPTLAAALEACIQLENAKQLDAFASQALREGGSAAVRQLADAMSLESAHVRTELMRVLASVRVTRDKVAALSFLLARLAA